MGLTVCPAAVGQTITFTGKVVGRTAHFLKIC
jgi:hypothetical protein